MFKRDLGCRCPSLEFHLTLAYLHNSENKCGFTSLIVVDLCMTCWIKGMIMAITSNGMPMNWANNKMAHSFVTSLMCVDGISLEHIIGIMP